MREARRGCGEVGRGATPYTELRDQSGESCTSTLTMSALPIWRISGTCSSPPFLNIWTKKAVKYKLKDMKIKQFCTDFSTCNFIL